MSQVSDTPVMDVYGSVRWSAVARYAVQMTELGTAILLARILVPSDYGLLGTALVFTGFLQIFRSLGLYHALVQRRQVSEVALSSAFFASVSLSILITMALVGLSPLLSWLYGDPRIGQIVRGLSLTFVLMSPATVSSAILTRRMAFDRLAVAETAAAVVGAGVALVLALTNWQVWALVWSNVVATAVRSGLYLVLARWRPRWTFCWAELGELVHFGAHWAGFSTFNYFTRKADDFLIGLVLGSISLGYYLLAYRVLLLPRQIILQVVERALFPWLSRWQDDDARFGLAYIRACEVIALTVFPVMATIGILAHSLVTVVLGVKWLPIVPLIYVFAPLAMVHAIGVTAGQVLLAKGRVEWYSRWGILSGTIYVCGFLIGLRWGIIGVALSFALTSVPLMFFVLSLALRLVVGFDLCRFLKALRPYAASTAFMAGCTATCQFALDRSSLPTTVNLVLCLLVAATTYAAAISQMEVSACLMLKKLVPERAKSPLRPIRHFLHLLLTQRHQTSNRSRFSPVENSPQCRLRNQRDDLSRFATDGEESAGRRAPGAPPACPHGRFVPDEDTYASGVR